MIFRTPFVLPWIYPGLVWRKSPQEKKIYLTFDDGPVPGPTEFVLDALKEFNAKATFFCIGDNVRKHPEVFAKVVAAGHSIGNHTFNHLKGWNCTVQDYVNNAALCCDQLILSGILTSNSSKDRLFRPPYGRIKRNQIRALDNYQIIMWDVLTHDYDRSLSPEPCLRRSIKVTRNGSIVVFHDSLKAAYNVKYVLPRYLEYFSAEGYSFDKL
jgi:peptidoglycan/xylan/chitin deacetylase (PgdA/CDA1 family)